MVHITEAHLAQRHVVIRQGTGDNPHKARMPMVGGVRSRSGGASAAEFYAGGTDDVDSCRQRHGQILLHHVRRVR